MAMKRFAIIFLCALLMGVMPILADEWNQRTTVTFSQPVELPGKTLPAGTYVFKLIETSTYRHVVQVTNTREDKVFGTFLAIPDWRLKATSDTVIHFKERPAGHAEAVRGWFFPGDQSGHEFVYGKRRAIELAAETHEFVPAAEIPAEPKAAELAQAPVVAITPEKKEVEIASVAQVEAPREVAQATPPPAAPAPAELPKTASPIPLIAALGIFALAAAAAIRRIRLSA
jgi:hypothetical protein